MKINEVITKKERVDEVLPAIIGGAVRLAPYALRYGKKAYDAGKKFLPVMKKAKAASHGIGSKVHAASEIGKKAIKKAPPDSSTPDTLAKAKVGYGAGQVDPPLATAAKQRAVAGTDIKPKAKPTTMVGPMSNLERKRQSRGNKERP
tara:strand:+ start:240 stop:680 length:441 start_codon:yes stop_codon:yes gene_type:complete